MTHYKKNYLVFIVVLVVLSKNVKRYSVFRIRDGCFVSIIIDQSLQRHKTTKPQSSTPVALFQITTATQSQSKRDLHSSKTCLALNSIVMRYVYLFICFRPASIHLVNNRQVYQLSSKPRMQDFLFLFSKVFIKEYSLSHRPVFLLVLQAKQKNFARKHCTGSDK